MARLGGGVCCWGLVLLWAATGGRAGEASPGGRPWGGGRGTSPGRVGRKEGREGRKEGGRQAGSGAAPSHRSGGRLGGLSRRRSPAQGSAAAPEKAARLARARPGVPAGLRASPWAAAPPPRLAPGGKIRRAALETGARRRGPRPPAVPGPFRWLSPFTPPRRDPAGRGGARLPHGLAPGAPHGRRLGQARRGGLVGVKCWHLVPACLPKILPLPGMGAGNQTKDLTEGKLP